MGGVGGTLVYEESEGSHSAYASVLITIGFEGSGFVGKRVSS